MNGATWIYEWGNPELATIWMERMIAFITWINLVLVFYKAWTDVQWICKSLPWQSWQKWESGKILFETILSYYSFYLWDNFIFLLILSLRQFYLFIDFIFETFLSFYSFYFWNDFIFTMHFLFEMILFLFILSLRQFNLYYAAVSSLGLAIAII